MRNGFILALIPFLLAAAEKPTTEPSTRPAVDRSAQTPDFCQVDPAAGLPRDGGSFCGPVSASNAMMYLAHTGYPKLKPDAPDEKTAQIALIHTISSKDFMNTDEHAGTGPTGVMIGIKKYVEAAGYSIDRIEYQGADHIKAFKQAGPIPTAEFLRQGLSVPHSVVLLNLAWKKLDVDKQTYSRIGGHWITLVGFGKTADGKDDPNVFLIHDPSPMSGMTFTTEHVTLEPVHGTFVFTSSAGKDTSTSAEGYLEFKGDIKLKPTATAAVLNRAVLVVLKPPGSQQ
jgi:hypothetical protein